MRRAVNTPDRAGSSRSGRAAWSRTFRSARTPASPRGMKRAVAGAEREQREGASGKWVAHWKMVHIVRPVWEKVGADNQLGRQFPAAHLHASGRRRPDAARAGAAHGPRRARSAERRAAVRQRVRPGPAGGRAQARRLLRQRRRALPDGGHGDRRDPPEHPVGMAAQARGAHRRPMPSIGVKAGDSFTPALFARLLDGGIRQAAAREQPRRARRLEADDAADRARDRRDLRARRDQAAVVHRSAQHHA